MRDTIKKHEDFITAPDDPSGRCRFFLIRAKPTKFPGDARYGLVSTKRTFKLAVHRNRARRLLRDWIRACRRDMRRDMDYVFIARAPILEATRDQGRTAMKKALRYISRTVAAQKAAEKKSEQ